MSESTAAEVTETTSPRDAMMYWHERAMQAETERDDAVQKHALCLAVATRSTARIAELEAERDSAVATMRVIGEELVTAGMPAGDRAVTLANVRALVAATTWDGSDRRCEHQMKWIRDWYGDPSIPNGTADCSRLECEQCGWVDPNGEKPERDYGI